jgi:amino acid permease
MKQLKLSNLSSKHWLLLFALIMILLNYFSSDSPNEIHYIISIIWAILFYLYI